MEQTTLKESWQSSRIMGDFSKLRMEFTLLLELTNPLSSIDPNEDWSQELDARVKGLNQRLNQHNLEALDLSLELDVFHRMREWPKLHSPCLSLLHTRVIIHKWGIEDLLRADPALLSRLQN